MVFISYLSVIKPIFMKNSLIIHKNTYDALSAEYEARVEDLRPVTENSMSYFSRYIKSDGRILDIGCGVGLAISVLNKKGFQATGIEISSKMADYARKRNPASDIIVGDFLTTEFSKKFNGVLAFAFIHLFPKKQIPGMFEKISSVLTSGGVALVSSTESSESKEGWYIKEGFSKKEKRFRKFWTEQELRESIEKADFKIIDLKKFNDPFGKIWMDFVIQK